MSQGADRGAGCGHGGGHRRAAGGVRPAARPTQADADRRGRGRRSPSGGRATWSSPRGAPPTTPRSTGRTSPRSGSASPPASPRRPRSRVYGARPDLRDALVVGVCQSGGSPDLTEVLRVAREQGALTLAVTNAPGSPLAETAELHDRRRRRARAGGRRDQDLHRRAARPAACSSRASGRAAARRRTSARRWTTLPELAEPDPGRPTAGRARRRATGSPPAWSPPAAGTPTRPPGRRR